MKNLFLFVAFMLIFKIHFGQNVVSWNNYIREDLHDCIMVSEFLPGAGQPGNCHDYAWLVALGINSTSGATPIYFENNNTIHFPYLNLTIPVDITNFNDATHIIWVINHEILHSAIKSQFVCFPWNDGWIQQANFFYPETHLSSLKKVTNAYGFSPIFLKVKNYQITNVPPFQPICPPSVQAKNIKSITGPSELRLNSTNFFTVEEIPGIEYIWTQVNLLPAWELTVNKPNIAEVTGRIAATVTLKLQMKFNGYIINTLFKTIKILPKYKLTISKGGILITSDEILTEKYEIQVYDITGNLKFKTNITTFPVYISDQFLPKNSGIIKINSNTNSESIRFIK